MLKLTYIGIYGNSFPSRTSHYSRNLYVFATAVSGSCLISKVSATIVAVSHTIARSWLTLLQAGYVVFLLQPWHVNIAKRQIKSPKLYFYDVGLASWLLGAEDERHVNYHPLRGNLFENLVIMEALKYRYHRGERSNLYF